jgi:transcriptional regulator with XRE-family HTH domain
MGNNDKQSMGEFLSCLRKQRGLTMEDVQKNTGISSSYICRIENASRDNITMDKIYKLSEYFGVEFSSFEQFCEGWTNKDRTEARELASLLLNERYKFAKIESIENKTKIYNVIKQMEIYCTKEEIKREDNNRLMDLVDLLRDDVLSA